MNGDPSRPAAGPGSPPSGQPDPARVQALALARDGVLRRIDEACRMVSRAPSSVLLLAVSKTFDAGHVAAMAATGQRAFGENYLQEALNKQQILADQWPQIPLQWHFIGPIQSNKTRPIATHFDWVHTVDRERIAQRLSEQRPAGLAPLQVCLQVNIDDEASKHGCTPDLAPALAMDIAALPRLRLRGVMAIPAVSDDPVVQRRAFAKVRGVFDACRAALSLSSGPAAGDDFDTLSMGMTGDLEAAVAEGATIVRVGTALFGARAPRTVA